MAEKFLFISESAIEGYQNQIPDAGRDSTFFQNRLLKQLVKCFQQQVQLMRAGKI